MRKSSRHFDEVELDLTLKLKLWRGVKEMEPVDGGDRVVLAFWSDAELQRQLPVCALRAGAADADARAAVVARVKTVISRAVKQRLRCGDTAAAALELAIALVEGGVMTAYRLRRQGRQEFYTGRPRRRGVLGALRRSRSSRPQRTVEEVARWR